MATTKTKPASVALTKADSRALWRAVEAQKELFLAMRDVGCTQDQIAAEREKLDRARAALCKVQALVRKA